MFACKKFRERVIVGLYYESLAYSDFRKKSQVRKKYGENYMGVTAESFWM